MNRLLDLSQYYNNGDLQQAEAVTAAREFLLGHGFTVIQYHEHWFDYMLDNKFAHFSTDTWKYHGFNLSSSYKPSRQNGTGARLHEEGSWEFSLEAFKNALNFHISKSGPPAMYRDLADRMHHCYRADDTIIYTPTEKYRWVDRVVSHSA